MGGNQTSWGRMKMLIGIPWWLIYVACFTLFATLAIPFIKLPDPFDKPWLIPGHAVRAWGRVWRWG